MLKYAHLGLVVQAKHGLIELLTPILLGISLLRPLSSIITAFPELRLAPKVESRESLLPTEELEAVLLDADQSSLVLIAGVVVHNLVQL